MKKFQEEITLKDFGEHLKSILANIDVANKELERVLLAEKTAKDSFDDLSNERVALITEISALSLERDNFLKLIAGHEEQAKTKLGSLSATHEEKKKELQAVETELSGSITKKREQLASIEKDILSVSADLVKFRDELSKLTLTIEPLGKQIKELRLEKEELVKEIVDRQDESRTLADTIKQQQEQLVELGKQIVKAIADTEVAAKSLIESQRVQEERETNFQIKLARMKTKHEELYPDFPFKL